VSDTVGIAAEKTGGVFLRRTDIFGLSSINYNHSLPAETPTRTKNRSCFTKFRALHFFFFFTWWDFTAAILL
jgi:hypothetical protein